MKLVKDTDQLKEKKHQISDQKAEEAIRTIIQWVGEDPGREGLLSTPKRVIKAFKEYFKGYKQEITSELLKTFGDVNGYDDMVLQKNISVSGLVTLPFMEQKRGSDYRDLAPFCNENNISFFRILNRGLVRVVKMSLYVKYNLTCTSNTLLIKSCRSCCSTCVE